jgi:hypothetical protein
MPGKNPASAEQEADDQEARGSRDKGSEARDNTPGDHDARDPDSRADFFQDQIARNLEQEITEEENSGAPAIDVGAEAQILVHGQCGDRDVAAVDIGDAVGQRDQRQ